MCGGKEVFVLLFGTLMVGFWCDVLWIKVDVRPTLILVSLASRASFDSLLMGRLFRSYFVTDPRTIIYTYPYVECYYSLASSCTFANQYELKLYFS